jgi:hypothetical protein
MAARTLTYTLGYHGPVRENHVGVNTITFDCNSGATKFGTVSDMFLLGKIPNGAVVTGGGITFGTQGSAASTFTLLLLSDEGAGTFSTLATLRAAGGSITANASTVQSYSIVGPVTKISYSDDRAVQNAVLALNCTVGPSETASFSFQGFINYISDGRSTT